MIIETELKDIGTTAESINVYNNGEITVYRQNETPYSKIVAGWETLIENAREMPAFGVSLHDETMRVINVGLWVEFVFDKQYIHSNMKFEKLLVKVESSWCGFNIVRFNVQGGYSGRCYFIDLVGKDMSQFYDILSNL